MRVVLAGLLALALALPLLAGGPNLIQNGGFETNGGANSSVLPGWSLVDEAGGNGMWVAQTGKIGPISSRCGPDDVQPPPEGLFAAMTTQADPGSHVLYQDVFIPPGSAPALSFRFFIRSASHFFAPDTLSFGNSGPNQQFRVDIIDPASNPFTLNVLQSVVVVGPGNPLMFGYETQTATLTGLGGRMVRLRFVQVDDQGCFYAGVDDVRLQVDGGTPAPSIIRFVALPAAVRFASASTLTWSTQNATSVEIDNGIGAVPLSGSRSVSLQAGITYTLTATGPAGTARRPVTISVTDAGPSIDFSSSPSFIQKGSPSTLTWSTTDATEVSIDNGIGAVATSGSLNVTPAATTEYTLTATGSNTTSTARATVFVDPGDVPIVSVTAFPDGIVGVTGQAAGAGDDFALTNLGRVPTTITLGQTGQFFTQSPTSFTLAAGATQVVTITTTVQAAGKYEGASLPAGAGVPAGLSIPVRLFLATAPTGTVTPTTAVARTEIAAPANENPSGSVSFTNRGTGTLQGIATSDALWLIPQTDTVVIEAGATKEVTFTTNRALRPDAASAGGAAVATLTLSYVDFGGSSSVKQIFQAAGSGGRGSISVTVVDVVKASATSTAPPPLAAGEMALFVPGLFQAPGSSSDLLLSVIGNSISDLKLYLGAQGRSPVLGSLDQIAPNAGLALPSILQSIFASTAATGTVQVRSASLSRVSVAALQTNTASLAGSFITALPTFRSDRSAGASETIYLAGIEKTPARLANVFVQEVSGLPAAATVEYLGPGGDVVSSRDAELAAFTLLSLPDSAPAGAASVRITNTSRTGARIVAYATLVDATTQDAWTIVDSQFVAGPSAEQIVAVLPAASTAAVTGNALYLLNPESNPLEITVTSQVNPVRRRAVRTSQDSATTSAAVRVTVGPRQTLLLPIAFTSGFARLTAARPFIASARSMQTAAGRAGGFGSALPVSPVAAALAAGQSRRFSSVDDSTRTTVAAATPVTYRTNVGLIEVSGQSIMVRLTLRFTFSSGTKSSAQGLSTATVQVPANQLLIVNEIARAVIGASRDSLGDLRNMQLDVEVVSGGGRLLPFVQVIDNGSGDSAIRAQ
jgi:hypothetical protein